jgi:hypothetical protein
MYLFLSHSSQISQAPLGLAWFLRQTDRQLLKHTIILSIILPIRQPIIRSIKKPIIQPIKRTIISSIKQTVGYTYPYIYSDWTNRQIK